MWPFTKKVDYKEGSIVSDAGFVRSSLVADSVALNDGKYIRLSSKAIKSLVEKYVRKPEFDYKDEVFDCDDIANKALGDIVSAANKNKFDLPVAFGTLNYVMKDGRGHAINFAFTSDNDIIYFDPQSRKWHDSPKDMAKITSINM